MALKAEQLTTLAGPPGIHAPGGPLRLLLGGRDTRIPGFINVDLHVGPQVDIQADVSDLSKFTSESVDEIYASHILEHFPHPRTSDVLKEWGRVLKKGGVLNVSVPDFDAMVKLYLASGLVPFIRNTLYGDQLYPLAYHYTAFTYPTLAASVIESGFSDARRIPVLPYNLVDCSSNVDTATFQPVSINLAATK